MIETSELMENNYICGDMVATRHATKMQIHILGVSPDGIFIFNDIPLTQEEEDAAEEEAEEEAKEEAEEDDVPPLPEEWEWDFNWELYPDRPWCGG